MAHALCRHGSEKMSNMASVLAVLDMVIASSSPLFHALYQVSHLYLHVRSPVMTISSTRHWDGCPSPHPCPPCQELPYSRLMEREADQVGLCLMARACFDPTVAAAYYGSMAGVSEETEWSSTHPAGQPSIVTTIPSYS